MVALEVDGGAIGRNVPATLGVAGDVRTVLRQLNERLGTAEPRPPSAWALRVTSLSERLARVVRNSVGAVISQTMRRLLPRDAIIVGDAQHWGGWMIFHFPTYSARQMLYPLHFGTLGYAVPGAVGAQAAFPERRVVGVCGDGGFMFCSQELATAVQHGLNVIIVMENNSCFRTIRYLQTRKYGEQRVIAADLQNPDFVKYADSLGCFARRIEAAEEFEPAFAEALDAGRPALLEIACAIEPSPGDYGLAGAENPV